MLATAAVTHRERKGLYFAPKATGEDPWWTSSEVIISDESRAGFHKVIVTAAVTHRARKSASDVVIYDESRAGFPKGLVPAAVTHRERRWKK